jgi:hypothetical protein
MHGNTGQSEGGDSPQGGSGSSRFRLSAPNVPGGGGGGGVGGGAAVNVGFRGANGRVILEY